MNIIILADKYQKRMKSRGCVGLIKYNHKNVLNHQHKVLNGSFPNCHIIYIYGFDGKRLISYVNKNIGDYPRTTFLNNDLYDQHNNTHSLSLAKNYLNDDCLLLFGDNTIKQTTFDSFKLTSHSQIFVNQKIKTKLGCVITDGLVQNIAYDLDNYLPEIYFISKTHSSALQQLTSNIDNYNCFIFETINKMIDSNHEFTPLIINQKSKNEQ